MLEVLAVFRRDAKLATGLDEITEDDEDAVLHPTVPPGEIPRDWLDARTATSAELAGTYCYVTHSKSIAALYPHFIGIALSLGQTDLDAAAMKDARLRQLTQAVAAWIYETPDLDGVTFTSRHGDDLQLWAIFERPGEPSVSPKLRHIRPEELRRESKAIQDALQMLDLTWQGENQALLPAPGGDSVRHPPISIRPPDRAAKSPVGAWGAASISVVIPTLNEAMNLPWLLRRMPSYVDEVVLVDGRSMDNTVDVARWLRLDVVVVDEQRKGKGVALRSGFEAASGEIIVMLDADGSMDPQEIGWLVPPLLHDYDLVKGSRYVTGGGSQDLSWLRRTGSRALTVLANLVLHSDYSDLCYGYIAFRRECLEVLQLESDGFQIETELMVRAARAGLRIAEVPSLELARISGASDLQSLRDGCRVLGTLVREGILRESPTAGARPEALRQAK